MSAPYLPKTASYQSVTGQPAPLLARAPGGPCFPHSSSTLFNTEAEQSSCTSKEETKSEQRSTFHTVEEVIKTVNFLTKELENSSKSMHEITPDDLLLNIQHFIEQNYTKISNNIDLSIAMNNFKIAGEKKAAISEAASRARFEAGRRFI